MSQSVLEQVDEHINKTAKKATQAASYVTDAFEDGVEAAQNAAKHGRHVAAELLYDTRRRVQRHPIETVMATFAVGIATGAAIGWMAKRRQC